MTATVDRRRKYATEEERLEAKRAQRRINDRKYYHQNPEAKIEKVKKYQAETKEKIKAKQVKAESKKLINVIDSVRFKIESLSGRSEDGMLVEKSNKELTIKVLVKGVEDKGYGYGEKLRIARK